MSEGSRTGALTPSDTAGRSGRQILETMIAGGAPPVPMGVTLGFKLVEVGDGVAIFEGEPGPQVLNPMGGVHGGWALALIDSATGCAGWTTLEPGFGWTTIETKANFSRPIRAGGGRVRCEGRVIARGRQVISCDAVATDADGRVLAHGTSTLMVLAPR